MAAIRLGLNVLNWWKRTLSFNFYFLKIQDVALSHDLLPYLIFCIIFLYQVFLDMEPTKPLGFLLPLP